MRRLLIIALALAGLVIVVLGYAFLNLGALVEANRGYLLARAGDALGRPVTVDEIKAHFGWNLAIDLRGVKVADDPAFADTPAAPTEFLQVKDVYAEVRLLPLLSKSLEVKRVRIVQPAVRLIRNRAGRFNFSTLGAAGSQRGTSRQEGTVAGAGKPSVTAPSDQLQLPGTPARPSIAFATTVANLAIEDGSLTYLDRQAGGLPINLHGFALTVDGFRAGASFRVTAALAILSAQPNLQLEGTVGPLMSASTIDLDRVPLAIRATIGPLALDQLRTAPALVRLLPAGLAVSSPVTVAAKVTGSVGALQLDARSDVSSSHVVYGSVIDKAAGVPLALAVKAVRAAGRVELRRIELKIAGQSLTATNIAFKANQFSARLDSDRANLANLAQVLTPARDYHLGGAATLHATVVATAGQPSATGSLTLSEVDATMPGGKVPPLTGLTGPIALAGTTAKIGPLTGTIGSSKMGLNGAVESFTPLRMAYQLTLDTFKPGEFRPDRQPLGEQMIQVAAHGDLSRDANGPSVSTQLTSASGTLANVAYQNLALNGSWRGNQVTIDSLTTAAFDGSLGAAGSATLGVAPSFDLKLDVRAIDLRNALESQKARAAETVRGRLTGTLQVYGTGASFNQLIPTLRGAGRAAVSDGKLVGVNVVAQALSKVNNVPGIGALVPPEIASRHPGLFNSPDTAIDQASLTFSLQGPRLTSHDITVRTPDYVILGDGWFDMDKQIDLAARILLSSAFSGELVNARRNVAYLENSDKEVEIPLRIVGRLPRAQVLPDVGVLAQRATTNALQRQLGKFLGGASGGGGNTRSTPVNPLEQLKGLFH